VRQAGRAGHERKRPASSQPTAPLSLWAETSATFQCDACGKTFDKFRAFGSHCARKGCVQSKKRWACDLCDRVFSSPASLAMHWTKGNKNACAMEMRSRIPMDGKQSKEPETDGMEPTEPLSVWAETCRSFECDACGRTFDKFLNFGFHCKRTGCVQSKKLWACDLCDRVFSGPGSLAAHWSRGKNNECAMEMRSRIPMDGKQSKKPETDGMEPMEPLSVWAETCRSFECDACGRTFDKFSAFGFHCKRTGCVQPRKQWTCDLCNRDFNGPGGLATHWGQGNNNACAMEMCSRIPMGGKRS
jgi:hypothetical protein